MSWNFNIVGKRADVVAAVNAESCVPQVIKDAVSLYGGCGQGADTYDTVPIEAMQARSSGHYDARSGYSSITELSITGLKLAPPVPVPEKASTGVVAAALAIILFLLTCLNVNAQTTNDPTAGMTPGPTPGSFTPPQMPTTPAAFFANAGSYLSTVNTNLTWTNTPTDFWTGANYQSGVNTSAEIGGSYDVWRLSATAAIAPEAVIRTFGGSAQIISGQAGAGISLFHYDLKITGYVDGGYNNPLDSGFVEFGARLKKKMTVSTYLGTGIYYSHVFQGNTKDTPGATAYVGWAF